MILVRDPLEVHSGHTTAVQHRYTLFDMGCRPTSYITDHQSNPCSRAGNIFRNGLVLRISRTAVILSTKNSCFIRNIPGTAAVSTIYMIPVVQQNYRNYDYRNMQHASMYSAHACTDVLLRWSIINNRSGSGSITSVIIASFPRSSRVAAISGIIVQPHAIGT